jgi:antirestriction protein
VTTIAADITPRVWIGSLRKYNEGYLVGHWFDALGADEVTPSDVFRGSGFTPTNDEELWVFDHENIPVPGEMSPHDAAQWGRVFDECEEHLRDALHAWVASGDYIAEGTSDLPVLSDFQDRYCGCWESFDDYARELADDTGMFSGIPEEIARHFDWASWTRELAWDYTTCEADGGVHIFRSH